MPRVKADLAAPTNGRAAFRHPDEGRAGAAGDDKDYGDVKAGDCPTSGDCAGCARAGSPRAGGRTPPRASLLPCESCWFLLLAAAAVGVALAAKLVSGYVLFVAPPYRVELSLNFFLLLAAAGFVSGYALLRLAIRMSGLPREVQAMRRRQEARAHAQADAAVVALLEGRYGKAGNSPRRRSTSGCAGHRGAGRGARGARHPRLRDRRSAPHRAAAQAGSPRFRA
jgi:hypothetical protein